MEPFLRLSSAQLERLAAIAKDAAPVESCAFLLGRSRGLVDEILPARNADSSPYSFSIEPSELLEAYLTAERKGMQVIGIFHSHPGRAAPSQTDQKFMDINPVVWVIYSTTEHKFGAYFGEGRATKIKLEVTG